MSGKVITEISPRGLAFLCGWEGFRATQYRDEGGTLTIGYGTTESVVTPLPEKVTVAQAQSLVRLYLGRYVYPAMAEAHRFTNQARFDAIADAAYNLGPGVLDRGRSLGDALRGRTSIVSVPPALMLYDHVGTEVSAGLQRRRSAEALLWSKGEY